MWADNQHRLSDPITRFLGRFPIFFKLKSFRIETLGPSNFSCGQRDDFDRLKSKRGTFHLRPFLFANKHLRKLHSSHLLARVDLRNSIVYTFSDVASVSVQSGLTFWLTWKKLSGSYFRLISTSRS